MPSSSNTISATRSSECAEVTTGGARGRGGASTRGEEFHPGGNQRTGCDRRPLTAHDRMPPESRAARTGSTPGKRFISESAPPRAQTSGGDAGGELSRDSRPHNRRGPHERHGCRALAASRAESSSEVCLCVPVCPGVDLFVAVDGKHLLHHHSHLHRRHSASRPSIQSGVTPLFACATVCERGPAWFVCARSVGAATHTADVRRHRRSLTHHSDATHSDAPRGRHEGHRCIVHGCQPRVMTL
jgi:hypothetical protein